MSRKSTALRGAGALALIAAVAVAGYAFATRDSGESRAVPTFTVSEAQFLREIPADGVLQAVDTTPIAAPQDVRMPLKIAWLMEDGSRVKSGDVVVRFDPSEMEELLHNSRQSTLQAASRINKERQLSRSSREKRDRDAAMAESQMKAAKEFESVDDEVFSRHEIIESKIDVELAGARMAHAKRVKKIERSVSAGKLEVLEVQQRQALMQVKRAEGGLAQIQLATPHAGLLLLRRDWRGKVLAVGDTVWPGQNLAEIPADAAMEAEVFVLEADGGRLEENMKATIAVESVPDRTFTGIIKRVDKLAKPRNPKVPVQYFAVIISIDETDRELMKIGQRVRATIVEGESEALVIPRQAVFTERGEQFVYRKTATGFERVVVKLGPSTPGRVVVDEGLATGDEIALRDPEIEHSGAEGEAVDASR